MARWIHVSPLDTLEQSPRMIVVIPLTDGNDKLNHMVKITLMTSVRPANTAYNPTLVCHALNAYPNIFATGFKGLNRGFPALWKDSIVGAMRRPLSENIVVHPLETVSDDQNFVC